MAISRVPATFDALVTLAETTLAATTTKVYRGAFVSGDPGDALFIGYDGNPEGDFQAVLTNSEWAGLGASKRDERFEVVCSIVVLNGDGDVKAAVDAAYAIHSLFEAGLRANPSLSQSSPFVAELVGGDLAIVPHPTGLQVRLQFHVRVQTRI